MLTPHRLAPTILREYDVRGTVGQDLTADDARALGGAFGTTVRQAGGSRVVVGYDGRTHSPLLEAALIEGLIRAGVNVERVGLGPTPMLYFAAHTTKADGGVMVTGSHNASDQNGFKMLIGKHLPTGGSVYGEAIKALAEIAAKGIYASGAGSVTERPVRAAYIARLLQEAEGLRPMHVAWDLGNGAAGVIVPDLVKQLPGTHTLLFPEVDGLFPNHHPDPTVPSNLADLQEAVQHQSCLLGLAFDGDADRLGAVDDKGRILAGDQILALLATEVLKERPGATIISEVKASQVLYDTITAYGGVPLMWKTGHSLIKQKMIETGAPLAGEMSGHIYFADRYDGFDDGIYAALRLLGLVSRSGKTLAELYDALPQRMTTPELRFPVDEAKKFAIVETVRKNLEAAGADMVTVDGVRVTTPEGWWLLRASNTQAILVARAESEDSVGLERLKEALTTALKAAGVTPPSAL